MSVFSLTVNVALLVALETAVPAPVAAPAPSLEPVIATAPKVEILGIWKGTSICTKVEGNEFCRDETVVYNVIDVPNQPATVALNAARIADGAVQPMYSLYLTYRPDQGRWTSESARPDSRGVWAHVVHGDELTGTGTLLPSLTVVRNVSAKRVPKDQVLAP